MEDLVGGRLLTVTQYKAVLKVPSLLFLSAKYLCAFADRLLGQSAYYLFAHLGKYASVLRDDGTDFSDLCMYTALNVDVQACDDNA